MSTNNMVEQPKMPKALEENLRESGIDVIGTVPWGTHLCQFYDTKQDLIDIMVPYFKAGLQNSEFCIWITSEPLSEEEVKEKMAEVVPNLAQYLKRGQIEIVPYNEWYLKEGAFNGQRALNAWIDKLNQALSKGCNGLRVAGNTAWLEEKDWRDFVNYEEEVDKVIGRYNMLTLCTYPLSKCGASEIIDVVKNHQYALIRREGKWQLVEGSEYRQAGEALWESEEKYRRLFNSSPVGITTLDLKGVITSCNPAVYDEGGYSEDELVGKHFSQISPLRVKDIPKFIRVFSSILRGKVPEPFEIAYNHKDGTPGWTEIHVSLLKAGGKKLGIQVLQRDITELKQAEEELRKFKTITDKAGYGLAMGDIEGNLNYVNESFAQMHGYTPDELLGKHLSTFHNEEQMENVNRLVEQLRQKGSYFGEEVWHKRKDNTQFLTLMNGKLIRDEKGTPRVLAATAIDITERKRPRESQGMTSQAKSKGPLTTLQERFSHKGLKGFNLHEMVELLLSLNLPDKDCKKLTKGIVKRYKTLGEFLTAPTEELEKIPGMTPRHVLCVKLMQEVPSQFLKEKIIDKPIYSSAQQVFDYLYASMRGLKKEVFKVLYLNNQNQIIDTEDLFVGTLDGIHIYPREIEEGAIKHEATGLIFAHNHPSGDCTPSHNDKQITRDLVFIGKVLQIKVLDHIIIGENKYFSFTDAGLIAKYEDNFLNLRLRRFVLQSS